MQFQGCSTNGIYFSAKASNVMSWVDSRSGHAGRRQSAVSNWAVLLLFRHVLLVVSNCRVIAAWTPFRVGSRNLVIIIGPPIFSSSALVGQGSELQNTAA
jgi:hypothetical protein